MELRDFQKMMTGLLSAERITQYIMESDSSLLVRCMDGSSFFINIMESGRTFRNKEDYFVQEYVSVHTREEFICDLKSKALSRPGFFYYFIFFKSLRKQEL